MWYFPINSGMDKQHAGRWNSRGVDVSKTPSRTMWFHIISNTLVFSYLYSFKVPMIISLQRRWLMEKKTLAHSVMSPIAPFSHVLWSSGIFVISIDVLNKYISQICSSHAIRNYKTKLTEHRCHFKKESRCWNISIWLIVAWEIW